MADLGSHNKGQWLEGVSPNKEVKQKWLQVQIQERTSIINGTLQRIEDLKKGEIVNLEAKLIMYEKERERLIYQLDILDKQEEEIQEAEITET